MTKLHQNLLQKEFKYFRKQKRNLLKHHQGQFVLIKGSKVIGTFTSEQETYKAGVEKFGAKPFLIKQVLKEEPLTVYPALNTGLVHVSSQ